MSVEVGKEKDLGLQLVTAIEYSGKCVISENHKPNNNLQLQRTTL